MHLPRLPTVSRSLAPVTFRKATRIPVGRDQLLNTLEFLLSPLVLSLSLWLVAYAYEGILAPHYVILSVVVFSLTFPGSAYLSQSLWKVLLRIATGWFAISALLFLFGMASGYLQYFDRDLIFTWWWAAPTGEAAAHILLRLFAPKIIELQGPQRRAIIAGMNSQGLELASRVSSDPYSRVHIVGFFDDRADQRGSQSSAYPVLGKIAALPRFASDNQVDLIYISLPMASQPRILSLLDNLRDTTASIYFAPDIFVTDLIQGRIDSVGGLPLVAVCETPFAGLNGVIKRLSDIVLSLQILLLIAVPLLAISIGVKLSSPGPVIFKQRRYGLDGQEIIVYKFRTMTVSEDGQVVMQAKKNDSRVTPFGRFLRSTSLDELPQFFNVLQGRMSIVGPRPHAVAHNEAYRKLIKGYMQRHKVKPGITGWAQVNGCRGETEVLEKMKARIDYDLDYLRNWSLRLDLYIIAKTVWVVLKENSNTY
jgi:putative colanic acid biosynthesis UDP-glucose lipid carrier transferase